MDHFGGRKERGGRVERVTQKHTLLFVEQIANGNLLCVPGNSNGLCARLVGWDGVGGGRQVHQGGDGGVPMGDSC